MIKGFFSLLKLFAAASILALLVNITFEPAIVTGKSMEPAIFSEDTVILNRMAYVSQNPKVGDIVVFESNLHTLEGEDSRIIKRVAAVAGDVVTGEDGTSEMVQAGCVYVLGDNNGISVDSRNNLVGQIEISNICGRVDFRLLPLNRAGKIEGASYTYRGSGVLPQFR